MIFKIRRRYKTYNVSASNDREMIEFLVKHNNRYIDCGRHTYKWLEKLENSHPQLDIVVRRKIMIPGAIIKVRRF